MRPSAAPGALGVHSRSRAQPPPRLPRRRRRGAPPRLPGSRTGSPTPSSASRGAGRLARTPGAARRPRAPGPTLRASRRTPVLPPRLSSPPLPLTFSFTLIAFPPCIPSCIPPTLSLRLLSTFLLFHRGPPFLSSPPSFPTLSLNL